MNDLRHEYERSLSAGSASSSRRGRQDHSPFTPHPALQLGGSSDGSPFQRKSSTGSTIRGSVPSTPVVPKYVAARDPKGAKDPPSLSSLDSEDGSFWLLGDARPAGGARRAPAKGGPPPGLLLRPLL